MPPESDPCPPARPGLAGHHPPPSQHPQQNHPIAVRRFVERSRAAIAAILIVGVGCVLVAVGGFFYIALLESVPSSTPLTELESEVEVFAYGLPALATFLVNIVAAVCFILWFYRAYSNLGHFRPGSRIHADSWTAWGFFVPIISLFRPYQIMREIQETTEVAWNSHPEWVEGVSRPEPRIKLWWGLYLTSVLLGSMASRLDWSSETAAETLLATYVDIAGVLLKIAAVVPAVQVVRSITALQVPVLSRALLLPPDQRESSPAPLTGTLSITGGASPPAFTPPSTGAPADLPPSGQGFITG